MPNHSSYNEVLVALLGPELRGLDKYIHEHSAKSSSTSSKILSSTQIDEAISNPSNIAHQTFKPLIKILVGLNSIKDKLNNITTQRDKMAAELKKLNEVEKTEGIHLQDNTAINADYDAIHKKLAELVTLEKSVEELSTELRKKYEEIDKLLQKHTSEWAQNEEKYFKQLTDQLEKNNIKLIKEEKNELQEAINENSSVKEKLKKLKEDFHLVLPEKISDFAVIVYSAIIAAQSRNLEKIDNEHVKNIVKKLTVIDEENEASSKLKAAHAEQYDQIVKKIKELLSKVEEAKTPSPVEPLLEKIDHEVTAAITQKKQADLASGY
jgi:DNA repair exonuclease SbcCD ATPase subunit